MPGPFEDLALLDRFIHEPARLAILTALAACRGCDFVFLQGLTGQTMGNLSNHLAKLEDAGLVEMQKSFAGKVPHTEVRLTREGQEGIRQHWKRLDQLRKAAARWRMTPRPANE